MSFDLTGEQPPLSAFWPGSTVKKGSSKENRRPAQHSSKHKRGHGHEGSSTSGEPPKKRLKGRHGAAHVDHAETSRRLALKDVDTLELSSQSKTEASAGAARSGFIDDPGSLIERGLPHSVSTPANKQNLSSHAGPLSFFKPPSVPGGALPTPPPTNSFEKRDARQAASRTFKSSSAKRLASGRIKSYLPTPGTSAPRPGTRLNSSRFNKQLSSSPFSFPSSITQAKSFGNQDDDADSEDPFADSSQASVPSSQTFDYRSLYPRRLTHLSSEAEHEIIGDHLASSFEVPALPADSRSTTFDSEHSSPSRPIRPRLRPIQRVDIRHDSPPSPSSELCPTSPLQDEQTSSSSSLRREIVPSSQSQLLLAPSSPLDAPIPLPSLHSGTVVFEPCANDRHTVDSSQSQIEKELSLPLQGSHSSKDYSIDTDAPTPEVEKSNLKKGSWNETESIVADQQPRLTTSTARPSPHVATPSKRRQRSPSRTPSRAPQSSNSSPLSPYPSSLDDEEWLSARKGSAMLDHAPGLQRKPSPTPPIPSPSREGSKGNQSYSPSLSRRRRRGLSRNKRSPSSREVDQKDDDSATESESDGEILNFVAGLHNQNITPAAKEDKADEQQDAAPCESHKLSNDTGALTHPTPSRRSLYKTPVSDAFSDEDFALAGAPLSIPADLSFSSYEDSKEESSSLPPAVTEFLDMFKGEGSYPDDFPQSLRC